MNMSENDNDDMIGFKDFLEGQDQKRGTRSSYRENQSTHELFTFLERENLRLDKLIKLYTQKTQVMSNYPQQESLSLELKTEIEKNKKTVISQLKRKDSHFRNNLREVFSTQFN